MLSVTDYIRLLLQTHFKDSEIEGTSSFLPRTYFQTAGRPSLATSILQVSNRPIVSAINDRNTQCFDCL
jgi:hypothetical protein